MGVHQVTPPLEASSPTDGSIRKRVCKACDRCRLKKSKCDGSNPCSRCKSDNAICVFGERKKSHDKVYPKGYVEMLENQQSQLVVGLQELYKRVQSGRGWIGSPLKETNHGNPLTHDILERLGALKQDNHDGNEQFEEDLGLMQQRLIASGAGFMQRAPSSDGDSEMDCSPIFEQMPRTATQFTDPFAVGRFPPTPPGQSPYARSVSAVSPSREQMFQQSISDHSAMNLALLQRQTWAPSAVGFDDNMDFINRFESPVGLDNLSSRMLHQQTASSNLNPCLPMRDWTEEEDFQRFFNPTVV